jgi:hypothetical protein
LILERLESPGRRPCRPRLGYLRRQAEVSQHSLHHSCLLNQGHEVQPPAAARTRQDIEPKGTSHEVSPEWHAGSTPATRVCQRVGRGGLTAVAGRRTRQPPIATPLEAPARRGTESS